MPFSGMQLGMWGSMGAGALQGLGGNVAWQGVEWLVGWRHEFG